MYRPTLWRPKPAGSPHRVPLLALLYAGSSVAPASKKVKRTRPADQRALTARCRQRVTLALSLDAWLQTACEGNVVNPGGPMHFIRPVRCRGKSDVPLSVPGPESVDDGVSPCYNWHAG